ncbi:MAG: hypothetical protein ACRD0Q_06300, partial [Acidimicrobiales bacterium]
MRVAASCATAYGRASERARRSFNRAVFTTLAVRDGRIVDVGYQAPFDVLIRASEFEYDDLVEVSGLEP